MFKSFALIALAGVASASWGQPYKNQGYTQDALYDYDGERGYGYGKVEAAQPAYAVPEYNQKIDDSKRKPDRYDNDLGYGGSDGFDDGYQTTGYGNSYDQGRRHRNLDLDDEKDYLPYGAVRKDARREDADIDTNRESADYRHENGDHQNQEYGEKDVRYDDDLDARGLSGLTGGSRRESYSPSGYDADDYERRAPYSGYDDDDYSEEPTYGRNDYQLGYNGSQRRGYGGWDDYSDDYGRSSSGFGPSRRSSYRNNDYEDNSYSNFGGYGGYNRSAYRRPAFSRPQPRYQRSYGYDRGYTQDSLYDYDGDRGYGYGKIEAAQPRYAIPEYNQKTDDSKRKPDRYDNDLGYGGSDGFDDGYQTYGYGNSYVDNSRRHQNLDLDDEKTTLPYGAVRKDARREDADINTDRESADYRHENGDHQNQEYGENDVRYDDDLDARGLSGLTGGSRRESYGFNDYEEPSYNSYKQPSYDSYEEPSYKQPSYKEPSYKEPSYKEPSYKEPSYKEPSYKQPSYEQPSYKEPSYKQPSYKASSYGKTTSSYNQYKW